MAKPYGKSIPREKPSGKKPYGLRPRDRLVEVPRLKGRPVDGWEYEPLDEDVPPGPTEVPEYIPIPRKKPVEVPIYTPTPRDQPVKVPIMRVRPADDRMFDPMLGEWPVDDQFGTVQGTAGRLQGSGRGVRGAAGR